MFQVLQELVRGRGGVAAVDRRVGDAVSGCEGDQGEQGAGELAAVLHQVTAGAGRRAQLGEVAGGERDSPE